MLTIPKGLITQRKRPLRRTTSGAQKTSLKLVSLVASQSPWSAHIPRKERSAHQRNITARKKRKARNGWPPRFAEEIHINPKLPGGK